MSHPQNTITNAIAELGDMLFVSQEDVGGKVKIEGNDSVIVSRHHHRKSRVSQDAVMKAQTPVPFIDTNVIPDRNAGIGSLLRDLQNPQEDPERDCPPLLEPAFAFIDVGVSRAKVSTALKLLLVRDLKMDVHYVATERPEAVPYANVTLLGGDAEKIRGGLSQMISSNEARREVKDWHYVVDGQGKVSSVSYSYQLYGNEVWESYFMGRTFMYAGEHVQFSDERLNAMLAPEERKIEAMMDLERKRDSNPNHLGPSWHGYRMEKNPLEKGLAGFGIKLQKTDVPYRIHERQNVLYFGNVLNHYPQRRQVREFDRIVANMEEGDMIILQVDGLNPPFIEVFQVKAHGDQKTRERVRWINTSRLEIHRPVRGPGSWQQIDIKPGVELIVRHLMECLESKLCSPAWSQKNHRVRVHQMFRHVFGTFFRDRPTEETLRIAIREALRRLPSEGGPKGIPVFKDDAFDVYGDALKSDSSPLISDDFFLPHVESADYGQTIRQTQNGQSFP